MEESGSSTKGLRNQGGPPRPGGSKQHWHQAFPFVAAKASIFAVVNQSRKKSNRHADSDFDGVFTYPDCLRAMQAIRPLLQRHQGLHHGQPSLQVPTFVRIAACALPLRHREGNLPKFFQRLVDALNLPLDAESGLKDRASRARRELWQLRFHFRDECLHLGSASRRLDGGLTGGGQRHAFWAVSTKRLESFRIRCKAIKH
jgi:hypothetical protein